MGPNFGILVRGGQGAGRRFCSNSGVSHAAIAAPERLCAGPRRKCRFCQAAPDTGLREAGRRTVRRCSPRHEHCPCPRRGEKAGQAVPPPHDSQTAPRSTLLAGGLPFLMATLPSRGGVGGAWPEPSLRWQSPENKGGRGCWRPGRAPLASLGHADALPEGPHPAES